MAGRLDRVLFGFTILSSLPSSSLLFILSFPFLSFPFLSFPFVLFRFRLLLFWSFCSVGWLQLGGVGSVLVYPIGSISNFIFNGRKFYALIKICRRVLSAGELKFGLSIAISLFIFRLEFLDGTFPAGLAGILAGRWFFCFTFFYGLIQLFCLNLRGDVAMIYSFLCNFC